jgi:hypothetical protein
MRERQRLEWNERVAHGLYSAGTRCPEDRPTDRRKHVRVLVAVDVRDGDSSRLQCANLGGSFSFDLAGLNLPPEVVARQVKESLAQGSCAIAPGQETTNLFLRQQRLAIDQHYVASNA